MRLLKVIIVMLKSQYIGNVELDRYSSVPKLEESRLSHRAPADHRRHAPALGETRASEFNSVECFHRLVVVHCRENRNCEF